DGAQTGYDGIHIHRLHRPRSELTAEIFVSQSPLRPPLLCASVSLWCDAFSDQGSMNAEQARSGNGHGFRQRPWLVDVALEGGGGEVGEQLRADEREERRDQLVRRR